MWAWELKVLRVKRSAPYRNSLQEEFRDIQLTPRVAAGGEIKCALHGDGDRAAGGDDGDLLAALAGSEKLGEAGVYAGAEFLPGFDTLRSEFGVHPLADHGLK